MGTRKDSNYIVYCVLPRWDLKINVHSVTIICSAGGKSHSYSFTTPQLLFAVAGVVLLMITFWNFLKLSGTF